MIVNTLRWKGGSGMVVFARMPIFIFLLNFGLTCKPAHGLYLNIRPLDSLQVELNYECIPSKLGKAEVVSSLLQRSPSKHFIF